MNHEDEDHDAVVRTARLHMEPDRPGKGTELNAMVASADEQGYLNAAVFGRLCLALRALQEHDVPAGAALFAWCERQWTEHGDEFLEITVELLLSLYALLINNVRLDPRVPFRQISVFVEALVNRHRQYGVGVRSAYIQAHLSARARDDQDEAEQYFRWFEAEADEPDSPPVEPIAMSWLSATGRWEAVLDRYRAGLRGLGENSERPWPVEYLHAEALEALVRLGRPADAQQAHRRGLAAVAADDPSLEAVALHLGYCALVERLDDGLALLARYLPELAGIRLPGLGVDFAEHGAVLLHRLRAAGRGGDEVRDGRTVDEVDAQLRAWAIDYADTVDRVNGGEVGRRRLARFWGERGVPG